MKFVCGGRKCIALGFGPFDRLSVAQYCRSLKEELLVKTVLTAVLVKRDRAVSL